MIFQCSLCLKVQQMSKYGSKVFKNLVFDDTRPLWNQLLWWNNAATFLNDIETSKMRENAKNSKTISMKRKSIFVKLIFRHAIMRNIINVKTPLHGIKQTDAAPHHSICMIYVWKCCRFFPPHPKMPPTSKLEKGWKTSLPACLLRFRSFGCHLTGSTVKT